MTLATTIRAYWPRRAPGLPKGQREVAVMPRFSDDPFRPPPRARSSVIELSVEGRPTVSVDLEAVLGASTSATDSMPGADAAIVERTHDFHCVTGWSYRNLTWTGAALGDLVRHLCKADAADLPPFAAVFGADGRHAVFATEDLLDPSVLLATSLDEQPITDRHGGAVRLVSPNQYGYKSVKHVSRIAFTQEQPAGSFGKKEHLRARIALEERHATLPNWLLRLPYRLLYLPTALMADRSLRRSDN